MMTEQSLSCPELAIIIPVFKHSVFIVEAIESALAQQTNFGVRIIVVNDGCPFIETHNTCSAYARTYPEVLHYVKKPNGGLSAARNSGIEYALSTWPEIKAVYFLDADNRLTSCAMQQAMDLLKKNNYTGWVYPNINMFGYMWSSDYGGKYSKITHLGANICEAGSLVSRTLLDKGIRFDESMKLGYEDWDFWMQSLGKNEVGHHLSTFGFQYRKRAESMLSDSDRDNAEIVSYMRRKHKSLYSTQSLLKFEHQERPRYAMFITDTQSFVYTTDPASGKVEKEVDEFEEQWWGAVASPGKYDIPGFVIVTSKKVLETLEKNKLLHWVFWRLESELDHKACFAFAKLSKFKEDHQVRVTGSRQPAPGAHLVADLVMVKTTLLQSAVNDPLTHWMDSITGEKPEMPIFNLDIHCDLDKEKWRVNRAAASLHARYMDLRDSSFAIAGKRKWNWRDLAVSPQLTNFENTRKAAQITKALLPLVPDQTSKDAAFLLPFVEFGGVEKVAFALAREMAKKGWRIHFVILDAVTCRIPDDLKDLLSGIHFLDDGSTANWSGRSYLGTHDDLRAHSSNQDRLLGLLSMMDLVINAHGSSASGIMSKLRRGGVKTANHLHVIDLTDKGRPIGHPYLGLAYEHAYDYFLTCSDRLAEWMHGMGVPAGKLLSLPNAAGYDLPADVIPGEIVAEREHDFSKRPLRILFMGRLDRQKGLERVVQVVQEGKRRKLPIDWKIVGGGILEKEHGVPGLDEVIEEFGSPPIYESEGLTKNYQWADILFIPSHWEGLPLTIIEAMRMGCVVIATDVGANDEIIEDGENGILLREFDTKVCIKHLSNFIEHPKALKKMSVNSYRSVSARSWKAVADRLTFLDASTRT
jgi:glycosyltransferase involved in cell wall biosynthesis